jgi:hypothetical protein
MKLECSPAACRPLLSAADFARCSSHGAGEPVTRERLAYVRHMDNNTDCPGVHPNMHARIFVPVVKKRTINEALEDAIRPCVDAQRPDLLERLIVEMQLLREQAPLTQLSSALPRDCT